MSRLPHRKNRKSEGAGRRWILYGLNPEERLLLLQCLETLELGTVAPEDSSDWILGCKAIQHPDVWPAPSRVQPTGSVASLPYVVEDHYGDDCGCVEYNRRTRFHHIPAEMLDGTRFPWFGSRSLAKRLASRGPFCSTQLALVFQALRIDVDEDQATGWVLDRLNATRDRGAHVPPCVVHACLNIGVVKSLRPEGCVWQWNPATNDWQQPNGADATRHGDDDDDRDDDRDDDDYGGGGDDDDGGEDDDNGSPGDADCDTESGDRLEGEDYAASLESQRTSVWDRHFADL